MHLLTLRIEQIRGIENLSLDLSTSMGGPRERIIFLGTNGSGKTTILACIAHAFGELTSESAAKLGARKLTAADIRNTGFPSPDATRETRSGFVELGLTLTADERHAARKQALRAETVGELHVDIPDGLRREHGPKTEAGRQVLQQMFALIEGKDETAQPDDKLSFVDTARSAALDARPPCVLLPADRGVLELPTSLQADELFSFDPRRNCLSSSRQRFADVAARLAIATINPKRQDPTGTVARMRKVIERYFEDLPRPIDPEDPTSLYETTKGSIVPLDALSDGERALLLILGEVALRPPHGGMILADELEQHLHPRWQRTILEALASLVPTAQLVIATQSPYLAACAPDDVIEIGDWQRDGQ